MSYDSIVQASGFSRLRERKSPRNQRVAEGRVLAEIAARADRNQLICILLMMSVLAEIAARADRNDDEIEQIKKAVLAEIAARADRNPPVVADTVSNSSSRDRRAGRPEPSTAR